MLPTDSMPPSGAVKVMGIRAWLATGTPFNVAGRIMNCGVRAIAAEPNPLPAGDSSTTVQALSAPCGVMLQEMVAFPLIPRLKASDGKTAISSCNEGFRFQSAFTKVPGGGFNVSALIA